MKRVFSLRVLIFGLAFCLAPIPLGLSIASAETQELRLSPSQEASQKVEQFHKSILSILKRAEALGYDGRVEELRPVVDEAMNMRLFGARTVGRAVWNGWNAKQRQAFLDVYEEYVCAAYATRFSGFSGQEFVTVGSREGPRGQIVVETEVRQPKDRPIRLDYVMLNGGESWGIVDIYLDSAVSEVALRRSEFSAVLGRDGYDGLIEALQSKIGGTTAQN